jgi:hypothetical protein
VKAGIDFIDSVLHCRRIGDIPEYELDLGRQVLAFSARQIIEYSYGMPLAQQRVYEMRAQEASTAGYEYMSHPKSLRQLQERRLAVTKIRLHPIFPRLWVQAGVANTAQPPGFPFISPTTADLRGAFEPAAPAKLLLTTSVHAYLRFTPMESKIKVKN